jgi:hypothetical protein
VLEDMRWTIAVQDKIQRGASAKPMVCLGFHTTSKVKLKR